MRILGGLFAGYSVLGVLTLWVYVYRSDLHRPVRQARYAVLLGLLCLMGVQLVHGARFVGLWSERLDVLYPMLLLVLAPAFYLGLQPVLMPRSPAQGWLAVWHGVPLCLPWLLPVGAVLPVVFGIGLGYVVVLARQLYSLRAARPHFQREMLVLLGMLASGMVVAVLGAVQWGGMPWWFEPLYATAIGLGVLAVNLLLLLHPGLEQEVLSAAERSYATTTLAQVDSAAMLTRLDACMREQALYRDPDLSLAALATAVGLTPHQLSELLNVHAGKGLARYLREWRVADAKRMLVQEPQASVLSVGLNCGFGTQSNFYDAFREVEGTTPGQYRKIAQKSLSPAPK